MGKRSSKKKILITVLIILAIIGAIIGITLKRLSNKVQEMTQETIQSAYVTEQYLVKSIGATGTVVSVDNKAVTGDLVGTEISDVFVEVGDYVNKGEVLVLFKSDDIEEDLEDAIDKLRDAEKRVKLSKETQDRTIADAERNKDYQIDNAKDNINKAKEAYDKLVEQLEDAEDRLAELRDKEDDAEDDFDKAKSKAKESDKKLEAKEKEMENKEAELDKAKETERNAKTALDEYKKNSEKEKEDTNTGDNTTEKDDTGSVSGNDIDTATDSDADSKEDSKADAKLDELQLAYDNAKANTEKIEKELNTIEKDYQSILSENISLNSDVRTKETTYTAAKVLREQQENTVETLENNIDTTEDSIETANKSYDFIVANQNSSVESAKSSKEISSLTSNTDMEETQVEMYEEQLEKIMVKAPISGTVTSVKFEEGDKYTNGALVVIQDCSEYEVEAYVGEYDISDIEVGQKVLIKTDATRDEELVGTVDFVSPTGTKTTGNTTYKIKIKFNDKNDRLRLDMSASMSIIIAESESAITVPYNAIQEDEQGKTFIELINEDESLQRVDVEVLMESNYYTEIKLNDNFKVGDKVRIIEEDAALNPLELLGVI